jgi:DNA-binding LacI/PurR family transcriptional regulator
MLGLAVSTTITEIAQKAGVSIATVSRAFNPNGCIHPETRRKILRIAEECHYKPNPSARSLSSKRTDTIGVILPELVDEFFSEIIRGIDEEAYKSQHYVLVASSHSQRNVLETVLEFMFSGRVDGVVLMVPQLQNEIIELISRSKRPAVLINAPQHINQLVSFNINNYQGAFSVVEHLINHGYQKLGVILGPEGNCDSDERFRGFGDALKQYNLPLDSRYVIRGDFTTRSGYYSFIRLMSQNKKPDAIFATNDMMALGIYEAAKNSRIKIPQDVAIAGFDDIFSSRLLQPRLTTVHVPISELGSSAVSYLFKMISGKVDSKKPCRNDLTTGLIIGGSCGCPNSNSQLF